MRVSRNQWLRITSDTRFTSLRRAKPKAPRPMTRKKSSAKTEYNRTRTERGCNLRIQRCDCATPAAGGVVLYSSGASLMWLTGVSRVDEPSGGGFDHGLGSGRHVELTAGVFDMEIHRALAYVQ